MLHELLLAYLKYLQLILFCPLKVYLYLDLLVLENLQELLSFHSTRNEDIDNMKSSFHKVIKIEEFEDEFTEHQSSNEKPKELEEQNSAAFESLVQSEISIPKKFASMKNTINDNNYVLVFFHKTNAITNVNTKAYGVFTLSDFSKDPETGVLNGLDKLVNTKSYTILYNSI